MKDLAYDLRPGRFAPLKKESWLKPTASEQATALPLSSQVRGYRLVIHSTSGKSEKISAATERAHGVYLSSLLSQAMISPVVFANPLLMASYCPSSGSLTQYDN